MAVKINMPKLSDTMEEGVLHKWNVQEGDEVKSGDVVAEVETDKATMEVEVFDSGTVLKILVDEGETVPLGQTMAIIGEEGEDVGDEKETGGERPENGEAEEEEEKSGKQEEGEDAGEEKDESEEEQEARNEKQEAEEKETGDGKPVTDGEEEAEETKEKETEEKKKSARQNGRIKASPLAKKMAKERDIDLSKVDGSGPEGRITKVDIESYEPPSAAEATRDDTEHKVSQMRKTIARRLSESKYSSPHYYETIEIDAGALFDARKRLNDAIDEKISFGNIILKACAMALRKHPQVNSSWKDDVILEHGDVSVAFAVAVEQGLVTPVIRDTDQKGLQVIAAESKELIELSRNKKLQPEQMQGSTFTISELGMFGIESFTAIINPPNACILAVGSIREVPVVKEGGIVPGKRMKMTLSSDHRIVDGATAAQFLSTLRTMLENPLGMLL